MKKIIAISISVIVLLSCLACLSSCKRDENNPNGAEPSSQESLQTKKGLSQEIFLNEAQPLEYGFIACYSNPQHEENTENEENSYGIMDSEGNVIVEPKYDKAIPASRKTFAISEKKDGENYSSMIDGDGKIVIPSFKGEIIPVYDKDDAAIAIIKPKDEKAYLVNMNGEKLLGMEFKTVYVAAETRPFVLEAFSDNSAYFISLDGELIAELPANKPVLDPFKECKGETVIACCYSPEKANGYILYGLYDSSSGDEIVSCSRKNAIEINENRFVLKDTSALGPDYDDFAAIYDESGKVICEAGEYQDIIFESESSIGIGLTIKPSEDGTGSIVKYYKIDADGNKLSQALDEMPDI